VVIIWINRYSLLLFGVTVSCISIAIISIPGFVDCLQDSDCTVNDVTDSMFQKYIFGFSLIGGFLCFFYVVFAIIADEYSEDKSNNGTNKSSLSSTIECRSCGIIIEARNLAERSARGFAGAGTGSAGGLVIGTIVAPGVGTLIGGALGLVSGASAGRQVSDICNNCCSLCVSKKEDCKCHDIIGLCRLCGCNIASINSSDGYCHSCRDSFNGEDV
jgi:hypothetical protein